jgi:hypothetical protein
MSVDELLDALGELGIEIKADGDRLRFRPRSALTPELECWLKVHKAELLAGLRGEAPNLPMSLPEAQAVWDALVKEIATEPDFPAGVAGAMRAATAHWATEDPQGGLDNQKA